MRLGGFRYHWPRLRHEFGQRLRVGGRQLRVRGYIPNRLTTGFTHEQHLLAPLRRAMAARDGAVLDVGVNTGQTLLKVLEVDPARTYVGFEPQVGCCFFVDQFLRDNDLRNCRVICLALSNENCLLPLFSHSPFDEMASLADHSTTRYDAGVASHFVPARVADEVLDEIGLTAPGIIKVDVEGAEVRVFAGLRRTIERARPVCFFEVLPNFTGHERTMVGPALAAANRDAAETLFRFFRDAGYQVRQIAADGDEHPIERFDLDTPAAYQGSDYVAYPDGH